MAFVPLGRVLLTSPISHCCLTYLWQMLSGHGLSVEMDLDSNPAPDVWTGAIPPLSESQSHDSDVVGGASDYVVIHRKYLAACRAHCSQLIPVQSWLWVLDLSPQETLVPHVVWLGLCVGTLSQGLSAPPSHCGHLGNFKKKHIPRAHSQWVWVWYNELGFPPRHRNS